MDRFIVEYGLEGLVKFAVSGCNTSNELAEYLRSSPHTSYRLVSCQNYNGNFILVWELADYVYSSGGEEDILVAEEGDEEDAD